MPNDVYYALKPHNADNIVRHVAMNPPQNIYVYFHACLNDELEYHPTQILNLRDQLNAYGDEQWFNYAANRKAAIAHKILKLCDDLDESMNTILDSATKVAGALMNRHITIENEQIADIVAHITINAVQKAKSSLAQTEHIRHQIYGAGFTTEAEYKRIQPKRFNSPRVA